MARPRKPRPELEGAIIEPAQIDIEDAAEATGLVEIKITAEMPVHTGDGRKLAPGETAFVTTDIADALRERGLAA